jgi:hypothetical protein
MSLFKQVSQIGQRMTDIALGFLSVLANCGEEL